MRVQFVPALLAPRQALIHLTTGVCSSMQSQRALQKLLKKHGLDAEQCLGIVAESGDAHMLRTLISVLSREQLDYRNPKFQSGAAAIARAAFRGHANCVQILLEAQASVDLRNTGGGFNALLEAAEHGHAACMKLLLEAKADANPRDDKMLEFGPPLWLACMRGHISCAKLLLDAEADPAQSNCREDTPLHMASQDGHVGCVALLLQRKANVNALSLTSTHTPLSAACGHGHLCVAKMLIANSALVNGKVVSTLGGPDRRLGAALIAAANSPRHGAGLSEDSRAPAFPPVSEVEMILYLLAQGADVDTINTHKTMDGLPSTALVYAAQHGHVQSVTALLVAKASPNGAENARWNCPLLVASMRGHAKCVEKLLKAGADTHQTYRFTGLDTYAICVAGAKGVIDRVEYPGAPVPSKEAYLECARLLELADVRFDSKYGRTCAWCGSPPSQENALLACARCSKIWYCGKACQRLAWKAGHRESCGSVPLQGTVHHATPAKLIPLMREYAAGSSSLASACLERMVGLIQGAGAESLSLLIASFNADTLAIRELVKAGAIVEILRVMSIYSTLPLLQSNGLMLLSLITEHQRDQAQPIFAAGGIATCITALRLVPRLSLVAGRSTAHAASLTPRLITCHGISALVNILVGISTLIPNPFPNTSDAFDFFNAPRDALMEAGGLQVVFDALDSSSCKVIPEVAGSFCNLICKLLHSPQLESAQHTIEDKYGFTPQQLSSIQRLHAVLEAGGFAVVLQIQAAFPTEQSVQRYAILAIRDLTHPHPVFKDGLQSSDCISLMVDAMLRFPSNESIQLNGGANLWNIAQLGREDVSSMDVSSMFSSSPTSRVPDTCVFVDAVLATAAPLALVNAMKTFPPLSSIMVGALRRILDAGGSRACKAISLAGGKEAIEAALLDSRAYEMCAVEGEDSSLAFDGKYALALLHAQGNIESNELAAIKGDENFAIGITKIRNLMARASVAGSASDHVEEERIVELESS